LSRPKGGGSGLDPVWWTPPERRIWCRPWRRRSAGVAVEALAQLRLQRREPALHRRVVEAVGAPAHAAGDALGREHLLVVLARHSTLGYVSPAEYERQGRVR